MPKKIDENEYIGKLYGDLKIIKFIRRQSGNMLFLAECQICKRQKEVWIKDIKKGIGNTHKNCVTTLPKNSTTKN